MKTFIATFLCLLLAPAAALAATDPVAIGHYGDWSAYYFMDEGSKVCFMSSTPKEQRGIGNKKRGDVLLFITHWSGDGSKNVVSVAAGYPYRGGSEATVTVDGRNFALFTQDEMAWAKDQKTDNALTDAIRRGSSLSVKGTSSRGTTTVDVYSLSGSADAYDAITSACKM